MRIRDPNASEVDSEPELDPARARIAVEGRRLAEHGGAQVALRGVQVHVVGDVERLDEQLDAIELRGGER